MDKENVVYNGILSSLKKKEILPFATTQINVEDVMLSEIRQTQKDEYCMISLTCGLLIGQTHKNREQKGGYQGTKMGEMGRCWPKGTNFSYKMKTFWRPNAQHDDCS